MRFSLPSIKCSAAPPSLRLLPNSVRCLNSAERFDYRAIDSSRKLGGVGEHLIEGSEKRICRLSFEFWSPHVIERRINTPTLLRWLNTLLIPACISFTFSSKATLTTQTFLNS